MKGTLQSLRHILPVLENVSLTNEYVIIITGKSY